MPILEPLLTQYGASLAEPLLIGSLLVYVALHYWLIRPLSDKHYWRKRSREQIVSNIFLVWLVAALTWFLWAQILAVCVFFNDPNQCTLSPFVELPFLVLALFGVPPAVAFLHTARIIIAIRTHFKKD